MMQIVVPALGESITEATITKWLKKAGDTVAADEPLVELDTDKVTVEVLAPAAGMLMDILAVGGDTVRVGGVLGSLEEEEASQSVQTASFTKEETPSVPNTLHEKPLQPDMPFAMPSARKMMREHGIDPASLPGTGKGGRITKEDVLNHLKTLSDSVTPCEEANEELLIKEVGLSEHEGAKTEALSGEDAGVEASAWDDDADEASDDTDIPAQETPTPEADEIDVPAPDVPFSDPLPDTPPSDIPTVGVFALPDEKPEEERILSEDEAADVAALMDEISAVIQSSSTAAASPAENAANENIGASPEQASVIEGIPEKEDKAENPPVEEETPDEDSAAVLSVMKQISTTSFSLDTPVHKFESFADTSSSHNPSSLSDEKATDAPFLNESAMEEKNRERTETPAPSADTGEDPDSSPLPNRIESIEDFMPFVEETIESVSPSALEETRPVAEQKAMIYSSSSSENSIATSGKENASDSTVSVTEDVPSPSKSEDSLSLSAPPVVGEKATISPVVAFVDSFKKQEKAPSDIDVVSGPAANEQAAEGAAPSETAQPPSSVKDSASPSFAKEGKREERVRMTRLRKRIAERLKEAQNTAATLTTFNEVDMTGMNEIRSRHKEAFEKKYGVKLGLMSFFVKAAVAALKEWPAINAEIEEDYIVYKNYYNIGVAVGTANGLVVPVIREADRLSFADIENAIATYGKKAREGKLSIEDLISGTFTISNGGIYGSLMSTPILNPPQSAILGMHKVQMRPIVMPDGSIQARPMMYLALSYDHRIIDGREAVSFLIAVKNFVENPERLLLDL